MKWLALLILLLASACSSADAGYGLQIVGPQVATSTPNPCATAGCDGTYKFCWTGDYAADTDKACVNSGAATLDGTISGGTVGTDYGQAGNGFAKTANNQYITWVNTADNLIDDTVGTVWMSIYSASLPDENDVLFESYVASTDYIKFELRLTSGHVRGTYRGQNASQDVENGTGLSTSTWTRVAYSWDDANNAHAVKMGADAWTAQSETLTALASATDDVTIGENAVGGAENQTIYIDNVYVTAGYQDADPYVP
jgi:hypothetical protein